MQLVRFRLLNSLTGASHQLHLIRSCLLGILKEAGPVMSSRGASTQKTRGPGEGSEISHSRSTSTIMSRCDCLSSLALRADHNTHQRSPNPLKWGPAGGYILADQEFWSTVLTDESVLDLDL